MKKSIFIAIAIVCSITLQSCSDSKLVVTQRPLAPYYQRPFSPGSNYLWVEGDWRIRNGRYVYQQGYWTRARNNRRWETGRWQQYNRGWRWQHGYWRR